MVMRAILPLLLVAAVWSGEARPDDRTAAEIDALIEASLAAAGTPPLAEADAATLLRRAWLDLGGRIPTAGAARAYLDDSSADRLARLQRSLIGSPAWQHGLFAWMADILRVQSRLQDRTPGQAWIDWLRAAIAANLPWDALARAQVTATGHAYAAGGGATGFALRDAGMPLDHAALMAQTFLGTRIGCAQCHDHPYDRWTRLDFLGFAAYSADAKTDTGPGKEYRELKQLMAGAEPELRNATRAITYVIGARVQPAGKDWLPIPKDWQYAGRKPGERVPAAPLHPPEAPAAAGDPRDRLAAWMTSRENPRFALAIGNRVWKRVFGLGLVEPVDDLRGDPAEPLPPLHAALVRLVLDSGYDLQRIHLALVSTRHWRRAAWTGALPAGGGVAPGRPALRLPAQVWWDSMVAIASPEPDAMPAPSAEPLIALRQRLGSAEAVVEAARRLIALKRGGAKAALADPEMAAVGMAMRPAPRRAQDAVLRASLLPQPAPPGHPLRILGQSDRELIDNGSAQPTATQALLLMNGLVDQGILGRTSRLMQELDALPDAAAQVEHLWLALLARRPRQAERAIADAELAARGRDGRNDLAWALLNGAEFRMVR